MVVCHCRGVTDRAIRRAVREGACSRPAVARACAAGQGCGGCGAAIDEILERELGGETPLALSAVAELVPAR